MSQPIYVAISGGGYHTHTCMSAWLSGLMRHKGIEIDQIFQNVQGFSCNSGGSWFLSHLAYSESFVNKLKEDSQSSNNTWCTSGYVDEVRRNHGLEEATEETWSEWLLGENNGEMVDNLGRTFYIYNQIFQQGDRSWHKYVERKVHGPLAIADELEGKYLDQPEDRLSWCRDKDIVIAASLPTGIVVLNSKMAQNQFFSTENLDGNSNRELRSFVPMSFTGSAQGRNRSPLFLDGDQKLIYSKHTLAWGSTPSETDIAADCPQRITIKEATIASSAALACLASEETLGEMGLEANLASWASWTYADFAPAMRFQEDGISIEERIEEGHWYNEYADQGLTRVADGGFADNTTVVNQLRHMHENGDLLNDSGEEFKLVVFTNGSYAGVEFEDVTINAGIAVLFGHDGLANDEERQTYSSQTADDHIWFNPMTTPIQIPSTQVFERAVWQQKNPDEFSVRYSGSWNDPESGMPLVVTIYDLKVTTVANETYGIPAGANGNLIIFEVTQPSEEPTGAMPVSLGGIRLYEVVFDKLRNEVVPDPEVMAILEEALGI